MRRLLLLICLLMGAGTGAAFAMPTHLNGVVSEVQLKEARIAGERLSQRQPVETLIFDENGDKVEELHYNNRSQVSLRIVNTYEPAHRIVESKTYEGLTRLKSRMEYSYDDLGRLSVIKSYDAKGRLKQENRHTFSLDGTSESYVIYDAKGNVTGKSSRSYDANGNLQEDETRFFQRDRQTLRCIFTYNAFGLQSEAWFGSDDVLQDMTEYRYNPQGFLSEVLTYDSKGQLMSERKYKYTAVDGQGNWVERITLQTMGGSLAPTGVEYRTISYHQKQAP